MLEYRTITPAEIEPLLSCDATAFGFAPDTGGFATMRPLIEPDRAFAAFDGAGIVGSGAAFSFTTTLPGGSAPSAGITVVGVLPSHRRRGILNELMRLMLDQSAERNEPIATLLASEAAIYHRYGFGQASLGAGVRVERERVRWLPTGSAVGAAGRVRLVEREGFAELCAPVYDRIAAVRPGFHDRSRARWEHVMSDPYSLHGSDYAHFQAVYEDDSGVPQGWVFYKLGPKWEGGSPHGDVLVIELQGTSPAVTLELWRFLLSLDLFDVVRAYGRPLDDPLLYAVAEPRRLAPTLIDGLWVRVLDVPAALTARHYAAPGLLVLDVVDAQRGAGGRFALEADESGSAVCERVRGLQPEADATLDVGALAALLLGGHHVGAFRTCGRLVTRDDAALARLHGMFSWPVAPWCPMTF